MIRRLLAIAAALALLGAACGDDSGTSAEPSDASESPSTDTNADDAGVESTAATESDFPVTVSTPSGEVTIEEQPESIVSLSPTATEILFEIGAGDQVVAVDDQSNFPPEAPATEGLSGIDANVEAIAELDADLVIIQFDPGDVESSLDALGIPTMTQPSAATLDDTYSQIEQLGDATGHPREAAELTAQMEADIAELAAQVEPSDPPITYYHELDDTLFTATSDTFIGQVYALAGLENIADPADDGTGFPQLSSEFVVDANPNIIFLADTKCCGQGADTIAARPGWNTLDAVREDNVIELDDDIASRWGPRVVDFLTAVVSAASSGAQQ